MGMKKLARKRLYEVEKQGIDVSQTINCSSVMKKALVSATQHRLGNKVITDIVLDLAATAAGLKTKATAAGLPIGNGAGKSYFCQVTDSVFGIVTTLESACLEQTSDGTLTDYDIIAGDDTGFYASAPGSLASIPAETQINIGAIKGKTRISAINDSVLTNEYLYIASGDATSQKASAVINCATAVHGNMQNGVDTIRLITSDGATKVNFIADSGSGDHDSVGADLKIKIAGMTAAADLAQAISRGINANANFTTDTDSQAGSSTTVTVTHAASSATSNHDNYLLNDDPQASNNIVVGAFTGGIDDGVSLTTGKLLIRFTGFIEPPSLT